MSEKVDAAAMARELNCHPETIRRMARKGQIPAVRLPGAWRMDPSEVILALSRDGQSKSTDGGK